MSKPKNVDPTTLALFQLLGSDDQQAIMRLIRAPAAEPKVPKGDRESAEARAEQLKQSRKRRKRK